MPRAVRATPATTSGERMSPATPIPRPPAASMSARAAASRSPSMSLTTTSAPSAASRRLMPPPMPPPPPVTTAILSRRSGPATSARARRGQAQLAVVPRDDALHVDLDAHPLVEEGLDGPAHLVGVGTRVALEHADA